MADEALGLLLVDGNAGPGDEVVRRHALLYTLNDDPEWIDFLVKEFVKKDRLYKKYLVIDGLLLANNLSVVFHHELLFKYAYIHTYFGLSRLPVQDMIV